MMRIRANRDEGSPDVIREKENIYRAMLEVTDFQAAPDLNEYFSEDFFHDGRMSDFALADDLRIFQFRAVADLPVLREAESRDLVGHSAWASFLCTFYGVSQLRICDVRPARECRFDCAEINSLDLVAHASGGESAFSLIVDTSCSSIEVVFSRISVVADEPVGFQLLRQSGMYHLRLASERRRRA